MSSAKEIQGPDSLSIDEGILQIPPAVKEYNRVFFDQQEINSELRSTLSRLSFQIDGKEYPADLKRMDFESIDDGIDSYSGTLIGETNSSVLLTISDDAMIGSITLNDETFYIEPVQTKTPTRMPERIPHIVYSSRDVENREFLIDTEPIAPTDEKPGAGYQTRTVSSEIDNMRYVCFCSSKFQVTGGLERC